MMFSCGLNSLIGRDDRCFLHSTQLNKFFFTGNVVFKFQVISWSLVNTDHVIRSSTHFTMHKSQSHWIGFIQLSQCHCTTEAPYPTQQVLFHRKCRLQVSGHFMITCPDHPSTVKSTVAHVLPPTTLFCHPRRCFATPYVLAGCYKQKHVNVEEITVQYIKQKNKRTREDSNLQLLPLYATCTWISVPA